MLDAYSRKARLAPAVLAALPAMTLLGGGLIAPTRAASIVAFACGGIGLLICGLVRDAGRRIQPALWESWGGPPTARRLRWREGSDLATVQRVHDRLGPLLSHQLPTAPEEEADPVGADGRYHEAIAALRERTRDRSRFGLLLGENIEYGFRRNCLGLRPAALIVAGGSLAVSLVLLAVSADASVAYLVTAAIAMLALLAWWRLVTPAWVRLAADRYADQLLASVEQLRVDHS